MAGTPLYIAPEQFRGMASKESDQYGLACIAYEMLTGSTPFVSADFMAMAYQHVHEQPKPLRQLDPALPIHMEQAIMKALSKERHDRYPSVTAFVAALQSPSPLQSPDPPRQAGGIPGTPLHTPPIREARQTPSLQNRGQNYAPPPGIVVGQAVITKPTGGDRTLAVLCYLSPLLLIAYGAGLILILICYFTGRKRPFVRFHFMQGLIFFVLSFIILVVGASEIANTSSSGATSFANTIAVAYAVLTLLYIILAGAGKRVHIPIIGFFASRYAKRQPKARRK